MNVARIRVGMQGIWVKMQENKVEIHGFWGIRGEIRGIRVTMQGIKEEI